MDAAAAVFNGELNHWIDDVRRAHLQIIDHITPDALVNTGWLKDDREKMEATVKDFTGWMQEHKNEIIALQIFYNQPYRRRELTYSMIKDLLEKLQTDKPALLPMRVWHAYEQLEVVSGNPKDELAALVALVRKATGIDKALTAYDKTVDRNFQQWILRKNAGQHNRFSEEQMQWLRMIKEYIAASFHVDKEDLELSPFDAKGGLGRMWQLFGDNTEDIINELNEELAA